MKRRRFNRNLAGGIAGLSLLNLASCKHSDSNKDLKSGSQEKVNSKTPLFKLSLAQWSLHKAFQGGTIDLLQFAAKAKQLGFEGIEYVSQLFPNETFDKTLLENLNKEAQQNDIEQLLIMVDHEGGLAVTNVEERHQAVDNHKKWVDAAVFLGCHSIRVNCFGEGTRDEVSKAGIDGLSRLSEFAAKRGINVIVENHGGNSSDGVWMANVINKVNLPNCGTLPDFGNFCIRREGGEQWGTPCIDEYDIYKGVKELMPFAKAVSAKSFDFDENGDETKIDYKRMLSIVKDAT